MTRYVSSFDISVHCTAARPETSRPEDAKPQSETLVPRRSPNHVFFLRITLDRARDRSLGAKTGLTERGRRGQLCSSGMRYGNSSTKACANNNIYSIRWIAKN